MAKRPRRRWSTAFKKRVVAEASRPDVSAAEVARQYDLNDNLIFNWKKRFGADVALVPVEVIPDVGPSPPSDDGAGAPSVSPMEIDLPCGSRLRFRSDVAPSALLQIISVLRRKA